MVFFIFCELCVLFGVEKGFFMTSNRVHRLSALAIMIALDYLLTPIFRIEGMVFMSSVMNVIAGIPLYAVAMAFIVAIMQILTQPGVASVAPLAIIL